MQRFNQLQKFLDSHMTFNVVVTGQQILCFSFDQRGLPVIDTGQSYLHCCTSIKQLKSYVKNKLFHNSRNISLETNNKGRKFNDWYPSQIEKPEKYFHDTYCLIAVAFVNRFILSHDGRKKKSARMATSAEESRQKLNKPDLVAIIIGLQNNASLES